MSDLTAVDILIDPDLASIEKARVINARLLQSMPGGWELDATHVPHITTLQRYVRTNDLGPVAEAVAAVIGSTDMSTLSYEAVKITHADWGFPGYGPTVLLLQVNDAVLRFQKALVDAVATYTESGGASAAFVTDEKEPVISPTIIDWVEKYVPAQIGDGNYLPHLTLGVDTFVDLEVLEAEPFETFTVHPSAVAIYHLGNNGTARVSLNRWELPG